MMKSSCFLDTFQPVNGVYYLSSGAFEAFEKAYIQIRENEKRLYDDEIVEKLPYISPGHVHYPEWQLRQSTFEKLERYFSALALQNGVLDIGCGNGWFTHHLGQWVKAPVYGLDVNRLELEQAARLFQRAGCSFIYADIFTAELPRDHFDLICVNSAIQYFPRLDQLLDHFFTLLREKGEIHIIDSPIYEEREVEMARQRTEKYYSEMGKPEMAKYYFHHSWTALDGFKFEQLYPNSSLINRLQSKFIRKQNPFPWLKIIKW